MACCIYYYRRCHDTAIRRRTQRPNASIATIHAEFSGNVRVSIHIPHTLGLAAQNEDTMRGANAGVLFFFVVSEVFYVDWKCDPDGGSFVAVDGGVYEGDEAISDRYSKFR